MTIFDDIRRELRFYALPVCVAALLIACGIALMLAAGCTSGTKQIAHSANNVGTLAAQIEDHAGALAPLVAENPDAKKHVDAISQDAKDIGIEAQRIHEVLPKVKDIESPWVGIIKIGLFILAIGGVFALLVYTGLAAPVFAACRFVGSLLARAIPAPIKAHVAGKVAKAWNKGKKA